MKKIKKGLCALSLAICGGAAFTVPMFAGCSNNKKAQEELENKTGYELVSIDEGLSADYYQNDTFSLNGKQITIRDKATNRSYVITLSDDMIVSKPDMSTGGEKEVSVTYDGNTYSFVINVKEKTQVALREQLLSILEKYSTGDFKNVSLNASLSYDAKFLNEEAKFDKQLTNVKLNAIEINKLQTDALAKKLLTELLDAGIDSLVRSTIDGQATNSASNQVSVGYEQFLKALYSNSLSKQNLSYLIGTVKSAISASSAMEDYVQNNATEFLINAVFATQILQTALIMQNEESLMQEDFVPIIKNIYAGLKGYFDALSSGKTEELAKFVSKQTNNNVYKSNFEQYGTPYFFYEKEKQGLNQMLEMIREENNNEALLSDLEEMFTACANFAKNVDEFLIYDGDWGEFVFKAFQDFAGELYENEYTSPYLQIPYSILGELLNTVFNEQYDSVAEFLSIALKEPSLGDFMYELLPSIMANMINNYVYSLSPDVSSYDDITFDEMYAAMEPSLNSIKRNKSFENFDFFERLANIEILHFQVIDPVADAVVEYAQNLDNMVKTGDFSSILAERAKLYVAIESENDDDATDFVLKSEAVLLKAADLLAFNQYVDVSEFVITLLNNDLVGDYATYYLKLGFVAILEGVPSYDGVIQEQSMASSRLFTNVVSPAIDKVKTEQSFANFDLMQRYYDEYINDLIGQFQNYDNTFDVDEAKTIIHNLYAAVDGLVSGTSTVEDVIVNEVKYMKWYTGIYLNYMYDIYENDETLYLYSRQQIMILNPIKTALSLLVRGDELRNTLTPQGLTDFLNNTFADVLIQYIGDSAEMKTDFNQYFVVPFVAMVTDGENLNFANFDPHQTVELLMDFCYVGNAPDDNPLFNLLLKLTDINNPNYSDNLLSLNNIIDVFAVVTNNADRYDAITYLSNIIYTYLSNGELEQSRFVRQCEDILNDIYDGIDSDDLDVEETFKKVQNFADKYLISEAKTTVYSLAAIYMVAEHPDVDYNKLFEFIELPQGITIDYNKMIQKLSDEATFDNMFTISNIETKLVTSQDNLLEEVVDITLRVNCDVSIASISGEIVLRLNINK